MPYLWICFMVKLAWMTDIHLNFLEAMEIDKWLDSILENKLDALLITGDIGEANSLRDYLLRIVGHLRLPTYFILGNHDYYHGTIAAVRKLAAELDEEHSLLNWLPQHGLVKLSETVVLIGHGAWGDAGYGDFMRSEVMLNDYQLIHDLDGLNPVALLKKLYELGQEANHYLNRTLPDALEQYEHVYVALHVPPFQESCWYAGKTPANDDDYLPHFACKGAGDALLDIAEQYPDKKITVLCGHTHGSGETTIRPNLHVITSGAEYGEPRIARIFTL
jgi:predicted phosphohydrolase